MFNFKNGDAVKHIVHGYGTVTDYDSAAKIVTVFMPSRNAHVHVHPVSLTLVAKPEDMRTPELVHELIGLKCADARGDAFDGEQHKRLGKVVDELRNRGVLD